SPALALATAQASALARIAAASSSRAASESTLESARPAMGRAGSSTTAAANTAPASGPRPASSTPHSSAAPGLGGDAVFTTRKIRHQRLDDTRVVARGELAVQHREARPQALARGPVVEPVAERLGEVGRRGVVLQQLGHDELAGEH